MITLLIVILIKENKGLKYENGCLKHDIDYMSCGARQLYKDNKNNKEF